MLDAEKLWHYRAHLASPYDGDTIQDVIVDVGFQLQLRPEHGLRVADVNTKEMRDRDPLKREEARQARDYVRAWLVEHATHTAGACTADWPFVIRTRKSDNFARLLAHVECGQGHDLSVDLIAAGLAEPFMVGTA